MDCQTELLAQAGTTAHRIDEVSSPVDPAEVLRYLGYPAGVKPKHLLSDAFDYWIVEAAHRAQPWAIYRVFRVTELHPRSLRLAVGEEEVMFRGAVGEFLGASACIAAFIATAGPGVERLASELLLDGDPLGAMIVNAVGAERAEAAETAVIDRLRQYAQRCEWAPTLPYSPGYCGMALAEQHTLFRLFRDCNLRVSLTESCLMQPIKSVSGLIGLGPAEDVRALGSPCERCELYHCAMRR